MLSSKADTTLKSLQHWINNRKQKKIALTINCLKSPKQVFNNDVR